MALNKYTIEKDRGKNKFRTLRYLDDVHKPILKA